MICIFRIRQILQTAVTLRSVTVTTTRSTRTVTRHHGRDSMGVQQDLTVSRQKSGRCGQWIGHEQVG
jgi:hypothetical protein